MSIKVGNTTVKKIQVVKDSKTTTLNKVFVGKTLVYNAEETFTKTFSGQGYAPNDDSWASEGGCNYTTFAIPLEVGQHCKINSVSWRNLIYSYSYVKVTVNNNAKTLFTHSRTYHDYEDSSYGPYEFDVTTATNSIYITIGHARAGSSWNDGVNKWYLDVTLNYTTSF